MVQKEVAETIAAEAGDRSVLSIAVQFYGKPSIVTNVPAASFFPAPEVDSAVVKIDVYKKPPVAVDDVEGFFKLYAQVSRPPVNRWPTRWRRDWAYKKKMYCIYWRRQKSTRSAGRKPLHWKSGRIYIMLIFG